MVSLNTAVYINSGIIFTCYCVIRRLSVAPYIDIAAWSCVYCLRPMVEPTIELILLLYKNGMKMKILYSPGFLIGPQYIARIPVTIRIKWCILSLVEPIEG